MGGVYKSIISQGPPNEALNQENLLKTYGLATDFSSFGVDKNKNKNTLSPPDTVVAHDRRHDTNLESEV